jgi:hypothetical protein
MSRLELATALVTSPSKAFLALKDRPSFWFPLLAVGLSTAAVLFWYYSIVDFEWLKDRLLSSNPRTRNMSEEQLAQSSKFMSAGFLMWSSVISILIVVPVIRLLEAMYLTLAGNVVNVRLKFKQWFALSCWTALPHLIGVLAMATYMLTADSNQIGNDELLVLSLNELFFNKEMSDAGFGFLSSLTLLHPWVWWLTVVGVRVWSERSWLFSSVFALTPIALVYGGWALWAFR